jgi:hypothetical protein
MIRAILLLVLLAPPTPPLTATWERPGIARVSWSGAGGASFMVARSTGATTLARRC